MSVALVTTCEFCGLPIDTTKAYWKVYNQAAPAPQPELDLHVTHLAPWVAAQPVPVGVNP